MEKTNKNSRLKWCVLGVLIALCVIYFAVPSVNAYVNKISAVLGSANVDAVIEFMRSYGPYAMVISFFLMVFSSVAAPSGVPYNLCNRRNIRLVAGGHTVLVQRHGGSCGVLLYCPRAWPRYR